jgi:hypothetical protein
MKHPKSKNASATTLQGMIAHAEKRSYGKGLKKKYNLGSKQQ